MVSGFIGDFQKAHEITERIIVNNHEKLEEVYDMRYALYEMVRQEIRNSAEQNRNSADYFPSDINNLLLEIIKEKFCVDAVDEEIFDLVIRYNHSSSEAASLLDISKRDASKRVDSLLENINEFMTENEISNFEEFIHEA